MSAKPTYCAVPGCGNFTTKGKAYCVEHIEMSPYVLSIMRQAEEDQEDERLAARGKVDLINSRIVNDVMTHVGHFGECSVSRLSIELDRDKAAVAAVVKQMAKVGMVKLKFVEGRNKKDLKYWMVSLP